MLTILTILALLLIAVVTVALMGSAFVLVWYIKKLVAKKDEPQPQPKTDIPIPEHQRAFREGMQNIIGYMGRDRRSYQVDEHKEG